MEPTQTPEVPEIVKPIEKAIIANWSRSFTTPEEMQAAASEYFQGTAPLLWTVNGVAAFLGISRQKLIALEKKSEYTEVVQAIKTKIEYAMEMRLVQRGNSGDQFALKVIGWDPNPKVEEYLPTDLTELTDDELERFIEGSA